LSRRRLPLVIWSTSRAPSTPTSSHEAKLALSIGFDQISSRMAGQRRRTSSKSRTATAGSGGVAGVAGAADEAAAAWPFVERRIGGGGGGGGASTTTRTVSLVSSSSVSQWALTVPPPTPIPSHFERGAASPSAAGSCGAEAGAS